MAVKYTLTHIAVLAQFQPGIRLNLRAVANATQLPITTVFDALGLLRGNGMLHSETERVDRAISDRLPRVLYQLTTVGADQIQAIRSLVSTSA